MTSPVRSGRLYYSTRRGGYISREIPVTDETRLRIEEVLRTIDQSIADGFLPPIPVEDACKQCEFHLVCGPREDTRLQGEAEASARAIAAVFGACHDTAHSASGRGSAR